MVQIKTVNCCGGRPDVNFDEHQEGSGEGEKTQRANWRDIRVYDTVNSLEEIKHQSSDSIKRHYIHLSPPRFSSRSALSAGRKLLRLEGAFSLSSCVHC